MSEAMTPRETVEALDKYIVGGAARHWPLQPS